MKETIEHHIQKALKALELSPESFVVEYPESAEHGDFSTSVAMACAKEAKMNPPALAEKIVTELKKDLPGGIASVDIAGAGFINFHLSAQYFHQTISDVIKHGETFGRSDVLSGKNIIVEYTDPNPFKEFHIGHLMSNTIGESLSRIIESQGAKVQRVCYQGDVGLHVAKTMWAWQKQLSAEQPATNAPVKEWAVFLGNCYATGTNSYDMAPNLKAEIDEINKKIYERSDPVINDLYDLGKKKSLEYFDGIYATLGTHFDNLFFESDMAPIGKSIVEKNTGTIFENSDSAIVFKGEKYNPKLHTRVFVNSLGLPTYEAKELALAGKKNEWMKKESGASYDHSIVITGNEINDYFAVMLEAMKHVYPDLAEKTEHISHGMMRLPSGKMSSRTGDVVTFTSLFDEVKHKVTQKVHETERAIPNEEEMIDSVSIAAIKYTILKQSPGKDIIFDMNASTSFEGDSGPYLQYAHTRALSVLEKARTEKIEGKIKPEIKAEIKAETETPLVEKWLHRFPDIVKRAGELRAPQLITTYLIELASAFNAFYATTKIVDQASINSPHYVALTEAFAHVLKNGLHLLGMKAPEKM